MKFAIITDSHIGPAGFYKNTHRIMSHMAELVLSDLAEAINSQTDIAFLAQLGDMSQDDVRYRDVEFDRVNFRRALWYFQKFKCPVYHAVGNHDRENLTYADLCSLLGYKALYYSFDARGSFDAEGLHCVFLYTRHIGHQDMVIDPEQLDWLQGDLEASSKPTVVFMHHSIADQDLSGNFWFEGAPHRALVSNREEARRILEESGKVIGVFNGHLHWNNLTVHNGIPYFTIQSCIEDVRSDGMPSRSYAIVSVDGHTITTEVLGRDAATLSYNAGQP